MAAVTGAGPDTMRPASVAGGLRRWLLRHPGVVRFGVVVSLLVVWEIAARFFMDRDFISPPSTVLFSLGDVLRTKGVPAALRLTLYELAVAFILSVIIGVGIGLAVGLSRFAHRSFMPIILLIYGLPQITVLPIFILFFGIGAASKIAFGVTHGAEHKSDSARERALDGREPPAHPALCDLSAHGPEPVCRHAACHDRRPARCAIGRIVCLDRRYRLFHRDFHPELRPNQADRAGFDPCSHGDLTQ
jgi:hypothetical protein